jgi:predicted RNA-binding Zn ribbon-like protein
LKVNYATFERIFRFSGTNLKNEGEKQVMLDTEKEEEIYSKTGGWLALDFTNTVQSYELHNPSYDYFKSYTDLTLWARQAELITLHEERELNRKAAESPEKAGQVLHKARALREVINHVFSAVANGHPPEAQALEALNAELAEGMSHSRIEETEHGFAWGWSGFPDEVESLLWPVVRSAADLLVDHDKLERVHECAGDTCGWLFVDTTKNHSRRWCDMRDCGNTAKARRHYQRKVKAAAGA